MKINIFHGRDEPNQDMDDWGFQGPVLDDVKYLKLVYFNVITVGFTSKEAADKAHALTGWDYFDDHVLEMKVHDHDLVMANGKYYGDWECS